MDQAWSISPAAPPDEGHDHGRATARQPENVSIKALLWFAGGLIVLAIILHLSLWRYLEGLRSAERPPGASAKTEPPPSPVWSVHWHDPRADLARTRDREAQRLATYGWIDRRHGIVHIPIDRAMELVAQGQRPAPVQPPSTPQQTQPQSQPSASPGR